MKPFVVVAALSMLSLFAVASFAADAAATTGKTLYHVVAFKYKPDTTPEQIKQIDDALVALKQSIPGITSLHWGDNISTEKHDHGYTQTFVLTFASTADRDAYLVHPAHKAFGKLAGPHFAEVFVIDFIAQD